VGSSESAGGNLATEIALAAKAENLHRPTHQLLNYPVAGGNLDQVSDLLYTSSLLPLRVAIFHCSPDNHLSTRQ
jgi:acetyl esterase/lipase